MPWQECNAVSERLRFLGDVADGFYSMTELCERYQISRKTGYKWLERGGELRDRSRRPAHHPHAVAASVVARIRALREEFGWGPRKLQTLLTRVGVTPVPARSTIALILKREGLSERRVRRPRPQALRTARTAMSAPNVVWTADFKGEFRTADGAWCYPLTVMDGFSRYLLTCTVVPGPQTAATRRVFTRVFREYGLPDVVRTDNGKPFASPTTIGRLSRLSVWWIRLGIAVERIDPGRPDQNGRHERFHRTLDETRRGGPAADAIAQQRRFRHHRQIYNEIRPHEALHERTPASVYAPSARPFPERLPAMEYSAAHVVRRVGPSGCFSWAQRQIHLTHVLEGEAIGLLPVADGRWTIYFGGVRLGQFDERHKRVESGD
jgi:putative transposase